jgi:S-formylglutathione hydrolase
MIQTALLPGWTRDTIGGKVADRYEPPEPRPFAVLYLHPESGETPATNALFTAELRAHRLRCLAPHAGRSWWVDRICPTFDPRLTAEAHICQNVVPWMESNWQLGGRCMALAGTGMGGQGAVRLACKYPERFPIAASSMGALDFQDFYGRGSPLDDMYSSREHCPQLWFACSPEQECYRGNDRLHEKLAALGIPHTAELDGSITGDQLIAPLLAFVVAALEREARRLA